MSATNLEALAQARGVSFDDVVEALTALPLEPRVARLPEAEAALFDELGIDPEERSAAPVLTGLLLRQRLERGSVPARDAAKLVGWDVSQVEQQLDGPSRSLLGFHRRTGQREWLLPRFQFEFGLHDLPAWARLLQALPPADETSPTALVDWLSQPCAHLSGRSRAQALADGYPADRLVSEATTFGMPV